MSETQRRPVPRLAGSELDTTLAFLDFQREVFAIKCADLDEAQLRTVLVESGTNLLGLVAHLTGCELYWFAHTVAGEPIDEKTVDSMDVPDDISPTEILSAYRRAWEHSNAVVRAIGDPAAVTAVTIDGEHLPIRWVLAHMITETARHAGHADIIREFLDGATGR